MGKKVQASTGRDCLSLVLKHRWYDLIASGEKGEEYRDLSPYWIRRLVEPAGGSWPAVLPSPDDLVLGLEEGRYRFRSFREVRFFRGYTAICLSKVFLGIRIGTGRSEWGAVPGKNYFVIALGERHGA